MTKEELYAHPGWQWCTAEGAELHTLLLGLQSTFREKVEWLEAAEEVSLRFRAGPRSVVHEAPTPDKPPKDESARR